MLRRGALLCVLMSSAAAFAATNATAQEAQEAKEAEVRDGGVEDIVVTANRRAEALSNVPISVAAYTQEALDKQNVRSFADIARMTPGVTFSNRGSGNSHRTEISIRGIVAGPGTATTGIYIDETPVQIRPDCCASSNPYPKIFDLERVEILRGPQGTLYGAGSEGGTIRFITPEPNLTDYSLYARSELATTEGGDPSYELGVAMGGPIVEGKLGMRVSASFRRNGGYVDHVSRVDGTVLTKNADWSDALVLRGALKWQPTETLSISPSIFYQKERVGDSSRYWEAFSNPSKNRYANGNQVVTPVRDDFMLPALKVEWDNGNVAVVSNSSYFKRDNSNTFDDTQITTGIFAGVVGPYMPKELGHVRMPGDVFSNQRIWTQEVRLQNSNPDDRLSWVIGAFYQQVKQDYHYFVDAHQIDDVLNYGNSGPPVTLADIFGMGLYQGTYILYEDETLKNKEISGYANVDFKLTDKLKLTAGVRLSHNKYSVANFQAGPVVSSANGFTTFSSTTDKPITPKFGVSYQADRNNLFYFTVSKGYRQGFTAGAVASRCKADLDALGISGDPHSVTPDYVWNYELGSKNRMFGGKLTVDASIYRIDWSDIQSSLTLPCGNGVRANFGDARSQGFDLNVTGKLGDALTLGLAVGYADAKFTSTTAGAGGVVIRPKGEPLDIAPWTVATSAQYDFDVADNEGYLRADYRYSSHDDTPLSTAQHIDQTIPRSPASSNLDLRAGIRMGDFDLSAFVANVTNDHPAYNRSRPISSAAPALSNYSAITVRPRTFGITGIYRY